MTLEKIYNLTGWIQKSIGAGDVYIPAEYRFTGELHAYRTARGWPTKVAVFNDAQQQEVVEDHRGKTVCCAATGRHCISSGALADDVTTLPPGGNRINGCMKWIKRRRGRKGGENS